MCSSTTLTVYLKLNIPSVGDQHILVSMKIESRGTGSEDCCEFPKFNALSLLNICSFLTDEERYPKEAGGSWMLVRLGKMSTAAFQCWPPG